MDQQLHDPVRAWTREEEEDKLREYVTRHGPHHWDTIARTLDIGRSGNSCRLKWVNYLKPGIVRGEFTHQEILVILRLRYQGNGWSKIAKELPGRTDNDIKNFWNSKRLQKEAEGLNCDVKNKMTSKLMERRRIQGIMPPASLTRVVHPSDETGGSGVTTDTYHANSSINGDDDDDQEFADELWDYLVTSCHIIDNN